MESFATGNYCEISLILTAVNPSRATVEALRVNGPGGEPEQPSEPTCSHVLMFVVHSNTAAMFVGQLAHSKLTSTGFEFVLNQIRVALGSSGAVKS